MHGPCIFLALARTDPASLNKNEVGPISHTGTGTAIGTAVHVRIHVPILVACRIHGRIGMPTSTRQYPDKVSGY